MFNSHELVLVGVDTFSGILRWALFIGMVIATFYMLHKNVKVRKLNIGLSTLFLTMIAAPILLLIPIVKNIEEGNDSGADIAGITDVTDDPNVEVPYTSDDEPIYNWIITPDEIVPSQPDVPASDTPSEPDGPDGPDEPDQPTKYRLTIEHADYVETDVSGEYEYQTEITVTAINRENEFYFFEKWVNSNNETVSTDASFTFTMPENDLTLYPVYRFEDPFPEVWSQEGTCNFGAYYDEGNTPHGHVDGLNCWQYAGVEYIDTHIALYSNENIGKDYEVSFTVEHFAADEQLGQNQETVFTDKGYHWKSGVVYRLGGDKFSLVSRVSDGDSGKKEVFIPIEDGQHITLMRYNGDLYYKVNDSAYILLQENVDEIQEGSFDTTAWFGAAPDNEDGSAQKRFISGDLSDMSIRLGEKQLGELIEVTFAPNGGSLAQTKYYVEKGTAIGTLPTATRSKKALVGWFDASGAQITPETIISSEATFTAHWINDITNANLADNKIEMVVGENVGIRISNLNTIEPVSYSSNNNLVATVDENGVVTAVSVGETDIVVTGALSGITRTVHVVVYAGRFVVHFDAGEGSAVEDMTVYPGKKINPLPRTTREGYTFLGWYDEYGIELTEATDINQDGITYFARWDEGVSSTVLVCKKAEVLHEETCDRTSGGCRAAGHQTGSIITYGTLPGVNPPSVGDAYDCDVNGDNKYNPNSERFYFVTTNGNNGVLVSFTNFEGSLGQQNGNIFSYNQIYNELPTTTQWGNENLALFDDKPARILTVAELEDSCNGSSTTGSLDSCEFLLENTKYSSENVGRSALWLDGSDSSYHRIFAPDRALRTVDSSSNNAVRPAIEVPLEYIQQGSDVYVTFVYGDGRPDETRGPIGPGEIIGDLPLVSNTEHARFLGWYTAAEGGEKIGKYTVPSGDGVKYYAHWDVDQFEVTFEYYEGVDNYSITVDYGEQIGSQAPSDPERAGHRFDGWYTESEGGTKIDNISNQTVTSNITYYAHFTKFVCKPASSLNTSTIHDTSTVLTFGTLPSDYPDTPYASGYAYDCDVNNDGVYDSATERFYLMRFDETTNEAHLIFFSNSRSEGISVSKAEDAINNYNNIGNKLPSTSVWKNPNITIRIPKLDDYIGACGSDPIANNSLHNYCSYTLELTPYETNGASFSTGYWLQKEDSKYYRAMSSTSTRKISETNATSNNGVRPMIEIDLDLISTDLGESDDIEIVEFNTSNNAVKGYYNIINGWSPQVTTFNKDPDTINNSTWGVAENTFWADLKTNFEANQCLIPSYSDSSISWTNGLVNDCGKPLAYDTEAGSAVDVYIYDESTSTRGNKVSYTKSSTGLIHNMVPGQTYYWEKVGDTTVNGYVRATAEGNRRMIDAGSIRNIRDLGGLTISYINDSNVTKTGTLKYEKLYRGERLWNNQDDVDFISDLGVDKEYALLESDNGDLKMTSNVRKNLIHYVFDTSDSGYGIARETVTEVMQDIVSGKNIYFHCRIGADRTGTLAYLLEGLLGVSDEERYEDYELTHLSGLVDRTRYYKVKVGGQNPPDKKFVYMMGYVLTNQNIYDWYLAGSSDVAADKALIQSFRDAMIDYD